VTQTQSPEPSSNPLLNLERPENAFPAISTPTRFGELASFLDERPLLPPPNWHRMPSLPPSSPPKVDMDAFVDSFSQLRLHLTPKRAQTSPKKTCAKPAPACPTVYAPCSAPHPALLCAKAQRSSSKRVLYPSRRVPGCRRLYNTPVFSSPTPLSMSCASALSTDSTGTPACYSSSVSTPTRPRRAGDSTVSPRNRPGFTPYPSLFIRPQPGRSWPMRCAPTEPLPFSVTVLSMIAQ
jgi:hypothetical protein